MALTILPFEDLVAAPLQAFVQAQVQMTETALQFMIETGFERQPDSLDPRRTVLKPRLLEVDYTHPVSDPNNPGEVVATPTRLQVPLLTLIQPPMFKIEKANVQLSAKIVDVVVNRATSGGEASKLTSQLLAAYAPRTINSEQAPVDTILMNITLTKETISEGMAALTNQLQNASTAKPLTAIRLDRVGQATSINPSADDRAGSNADASEREDA
jgi:Protein of unknown function (DUF2589)